MADKQAREAADSVDEAVAQAAAAAITAFRRLNNETNAEYMNCVTNCTKISPDSAVVVACINGCATVNAPRGGDLRLIA